MEETKQAPRWIAGIEPPKELLNATGAQIAVVNGRSVDTTMGFTPLEGLVMATRSGTVDPGLVLWLEQHEDLSPSAVADALEHRSGLLALAGTADMREVQARAAAGDGRERCTSSGRCAVTENCPGTLGALVRGLLRRSRLHALPPSKRSEIRQRSGCDPTNSAAPPDHLVRRVLVRIA